MGGAPCGAFVALMRGSCQRTALGRRQIELGEDAVGFLVFGKAQITPLAVPEKIHDHVEVLQVKS